MSEKPCLLLKPNREKALLRKHPWIFSGAVAEIKGDPAKGETLDVLSHDGTFIAKGAYSPHSQIVLRVWSWDENESIDVNFFRRKVKQAVENRQPLWEKGETTAVRLIHGESDYLPGLVVDRFGDGLVAQFLSWGSERWQEELLEVLEEVTGAAWIYERSDADVRKLEGLPSNTGAASGKVPESVEIMEHGLRYHVDIAGGHKTGFYIDQRENRLLLRDFAKGKEVLDCFGYSGAFTLNALIGGAKFVTLVDSSNHALEAAQEHLSMNEMDTSKVEIIQGDAFQLLRKFRDMDKSFDLIILDPPKFAPTAAQAQRAARGYKDINLLAFKMLRPGGVLFTFSCSGGVPDPLFQKIVADAALDAGVDAQIIQRMSQGPDHPVAASFPEGAYLKGLVCRVVK